MMRLPPTYTYTPQTIQSKNTRRCAILIFNVLGYTTLQYTMQYELCLYLSKYNTLSERQLVYVITGVPLCPWLLPS